MVNKKHSVGRNADIILEAPGEVGVNVLFVGGVNR